MGTASNKKVLVAGNFVKISANKNRNYWSLLSCLVKEQEDNEDEDDGTQTTNQLLAIKAILQNQTTKNKITTKWKQKVANRSGILDTGCTLGAGAEKDVDCFYNTDLPSRKVFMQPDKSKITAMKKMQLKHNLWAGASKMNTVPNLHTTLISVPKMAEHGYIAVFNKHEARINDGTTTKLMASGNPIIVAPRCEDTGLWKMELDLDYKILGRKDPKHFIASIDKANAIFNLPNTNTRHSLLFYHALAGFSVKETFLDAVRVGNYATWPGLTTTLIAKHFPDLEETQKGHMKGQQKGIRSTKVREQAEIKIEPGTEVLPQQPMKKQHNIFVVNYKLAKEVHTNQMGAFHVTTQRGYRYIMVGIHLDANYIFC
jgi:hypothetical protein